MELTPEQIAKLEPCLTLRDGVNAGVIFVDSVDLEVYGNWLFTVIEDRTGYVFCKIWDSSVSPQQLKNPGRLFLNVPENLQLDHRNHNTLDLRRENLRVATPSQNAQNRRITSRNTSGYKGVSFVKKTGRYDANIKLKFCSKYLGSFVYAEDAARAYDAAAKKHFGEFALLNFPEAAWN